MSTIPYFETERLASGFLAAVKSAYENEGISELEARWLSQMQGELPVDMKVEMVTNVHPLPGAALLITYAEANKPAAYTYSVWSGLAAYDSTQLAEKALQGPVKGWTGTAPRLNYLEMKQAVFDQWSQHQVLVQTQRLEQLALWVGELPRLPATLAIALQAQFKSLLPTSQAVHEHGLLQVDSETDKPVATTTLGEVALQVLCNQNNESKVERRYVDGAGTLLSGADASAWEQAVGRAVSGLRQTYGEVLGRWWTATLDKTDMNRSAAAMVIVADSFARAVLNGHRDGVLDAGQAKWMHEVLIADLPPVRRLAYTVDGLADDIPYAGLVVLPGSAAVDGPLFVYSANTGIRRFPNEAALKEFFREVSLQEHRPQGISQRHWPALQTSAARTVALEPVTATLPGAVVQSIIEVIQHNLIHVLGKPAGQPEAAIANFDDALDIRALLDRRLDCIDSAGRWMASGRLKEAPLTSVTSVATDLSGRIRQIQALAKRYDQLRSLQPSIGECIEGQLSPEIITVSEGLLDAAAVRLVYDGTSHTLEEFFLKRLTGYGIGNVIYGVSLADAKGKPLAWPDAQWLLGRIDSHTKTFKENYKNRLTYFESHTYRCAQGVLDIAHETSKAYDTLLRADLAQARDEGKIDTTLLDALADLLDQRPPPRLVQHSLYLSFSSTHDRAEISNSFAISLSDAPLKGVLQWTPLAGLQPYPNLTWMRHAINRTLTTAVDMREWATLLAPWAGRQLVRESALPPSTTQRAQLVIEPAAGNLVSYLCASERIRHKAQAAEDLTLATSCRFDPQLFRRYLTSRDDPLTVGIRGSSEALYNTRFNFTLPKWLTSASATDLRIYGALLDRCAQMATPQLSYLFGVPDTLAYAREKLKAALLADDPNYPDDSDQISVTLAHYETEYPQTGQTPGMLPAHTSRVTRTLTEFSLTHFTEFSTAAMYVGVAQPGKTVPDPKYLRDLVTRVDVGTSYQQLLADKLSSKDPDFQKRRQLFTLGMHPNLMACAFQARMEKSLSRTAAHYLARVLGSPDALAREPVDGVALQFGPLQLQAGNLQPDTVDSLFVVAPVDPLKGPLVLYAAYRDDYILTEFTDRADLLKRLHDDKRLEALVLDNLGVTERARYSHGGLVRPNMLVGPEDNFTFEPDPGLTRLVLEPIKGNVFHYLFEQNNKTLIHRASLRTVTSGQAKWQVWREMLRLSIEQATVLAPRPLAVLINLWQAFEWLEASLQSARKRSWGQALAEFTTALASFATLHDPHADTALDRAPGPREIGPGKKPPPSEPLMSIAVETTSQRLSREFEAHDVVLDGLSFDPATSIYSSLDGSRSYVPLDGKVYEIRSFDARWYIIKGDRTGPAIRLRSDHLWELQMGLRGGNDDLVAALEIAQIEANIPKVFTVQGNGIAEIASNHYGYALQIQTAHALAVRMLSTTLGNLFAWHTWEPLPEITRDILRSTFGEEPNERVLTRLRSHCKALLDELLSPNMSPLTSNRYVSGYNVPGQIPRIALTYRGDAKKRIFLTELFFKIIDDVRMNSMARDVDLLAHHQASTLLHELSHLVLKTEDIAYVDAIVPSLDVLEQSTPSSLAFYNRIKDAWEKGFTAATPPDQLFKTHDIYGLRDLRTKDGSAKAAILRLSGTSTLDEARQVFRDNAEKRADMILSNADSLALLISRLGQSSTLEVERAAQAQAEDGK